MMILGKNTKAAEDMENKYANAIVRAYYIDKDWNQYTFCSKNMLETIYLKDVKKYIKKLLKWYDGNITKMCVHTPLTINAVKWFMKEYKIVIKKEGK